MTNLYYTAPDDPIFKEMKAVCIKVWGRYKDSPGGYMDEKINRIKDIQNISDNFMFMFAMFDMENQAEVVSKLTQETKQALLERMIAGGNDNSYLNQIGL